MLTHFRSLFPARDDARAIQRHWKGDIAAGLTVGVVALPLALAFAVASGVSAEFGLITAVVAGLVAAIFGGSNYQVSGPTGAMVVIIAPVAAKHGAGAVPMLALMTGVLVVAAGILGLGRAVSLLPWPVIEGFTAGIAGLLFIQQIPNILGVKAKSGGNSIMMAIDAIKQAQWPTLGITVGITALTVAVIFLLGKISPRIPGSLVAVVLSTIVAVAANLSIPAIGQLPDSLPAPHVPAGGLTLMKALLPVALASAFLCAIESLLSARVAAGMVKGGSYNPDRELVGQGLANVASSFFGGMPATGAIARTAVNIRSGGRSRLSAIIHAIFFIGVIYLASDIVGLIPLAALAGVLVVTCINMVDRANAFQIFHSTRSDMLVFVITATLTIGLDIIWAVVVGVSIACVLVLRHLARHSGVYREDSGDPRIAIVRIDGAMFFGVADRIEHEIPKLTGVQVVILRLSRVGVVDASGAKALSDIVDKIISSGHSVIVKGASPEIRSMAIRMGLLTEEQADYRYKDTMEEALERARAVVSSAN